MSYTPDEITQLQRAVIRFGAQSGTDTPALVAARRARYEREARTLCAGCPVAGECLALAVWEERDEPSSCVHGVRGATAPWERVRMRWDDVMAACETVKEVA